MITSLNERTYSHDRCCRNVKAGQLDFQVGGMTGTEETNSTQALQYQDQLCETRLMIGINVGTHSLGIA